MPDMPRHEMRFLARTCPEQHAASADFQTGRMRQTVQSYTERMTGHLSSKPGMPPTSKAENMHGHAKLVIEAQPRLFCCYAHP